MNKLPSLSGEELLKLLLFLGFEKVRQKGSHARLKHEDKRATTVPIHKGRVLPKGLLRAIIRDDLNLSLEEFIDIRSEEHTSELQSH